MKRNRWTKLWYHRQQPSNILLERSKLSQVAEEVGADWKQADFYDSAEQYMEDAWTYTIWPFIQDCDFSCVIDLAAGHGRNTRKLREIAKKLYIVDIREENIQFCRQRFGEDWKIIYIRNDGLTLNGIADAEVTLVYCFDAMVHFDSDVIRSYLSEFYRVLKPGGYGFCHHSNYDDNPSGDLHDNPGWRNFMSQNLFIHYCSKEGLDVVRSQIIDWSSPETDCLTLFRKPQ